MSIDRTNPPEPRPLPSLVRLPTATAALVLALLGTGCLGAPNALAPGLRGSIGMPHHGVQTEAVELPPRGDGFVRFRPHSPTHWGNPRLVSAIQEVARTVLETSPESAPLVVGD